MTRVAQVAFALLVVATFGAFFVAQRLKAAPSLVLEAKARPLFSPNQDGRKDRARWSFMLKRDDQMSVRVVDDDGDAVRTLADRRNIEAYTRQGFDWDGATDAGAMAPDGTYRLRLSLRRQGRSITIAAVEKDTTPPSPEVISIGPEDDPGPEVLPRADGDPAEVRVSVPGTNRELEVWRTDVRPAQRVIGPRELPDGDQVQRWRWNATDDEGQPVPAGTYLVVARSRDAAGNIGESVARLPPAPGYGEGLEGRGGVQVRYLSAQALHAPAAAREPMMIAVGSPGGDFAWTVRRAGQREIRKDGSGSRSRLVRFRAPGGRSGLYIFEARTPGGDVARTPFYVQGDKAGDVLVILPAITWQGRNRVDDDGDGWPDTLEHGLPVDTRRPYAGGELPRDLRELAAPLLIALDREGLRYEVTTDLALARGAGPGLEGREGVVLAGEVRWLPDEAQRALRTFVQRGGGVLVTGPDSLRRSAQVTPSRVVEPRPAAARTLFGARLAPVRRVPTTVTATQDELELFAGTGGTFAGFGAFEETLDLAGGTELAATAVTQESARSVIVGARLGDGLVLRTGLPELPARADDDPELTTLLRRMWTLLGT
ncbi:MAG TPA: N,N-dimethylformamidase beta subunit family domain-containing protein [Solirubrobacteraceae bacterium]|nr:N,N-dimethylformamidase beta subunit family domain-containing protein [Solirubrobacteraceae bacterium]